MTFLPPTPDYHRGYEQAKWNFYEPDVLPLWVADTDFFSPEPVREALRGLIDHGIFGYQMRSAALTDALLTRLRDRHGISAGEKDLTFLPNLVAGLTVCARMAGPAGTGILVTTPIYPPFLNAIRFTGQRLVDVPLVRETTGRSLSYTIDFDAVEAALTPDVRMWMLCNPHNPVGRSYTRDELMRVADICLKHNLVLVSDEIHADLVMDGGVALSPASLGPEIAERTITLNAPSKAFNLPGIGFGFAVATGELRDQFQQHAWMTGLHTSPFGIVAAAAAYQHGQPYLDEVLPYLRANRDFLADAITERLPGVTFTVPEATFLMWLDFSAWNLPEPAAKYLLERARVGLNAGSDFGGEAYAGYARLNFGCTRETLDAALERIAGVVPAAASA